MKKLIVALAAVAMLAGCVKMSTTPPADMPSYVKIMPGGAPMMSMVVGPLTAEVFQTASSPEDVLAFYRTQAAADGLTETAPQPGTNASEGQQATFTDATTSKMLVVVAKAQSGQTMVTLTYKPAAKAS